MVFKTPDIGWAKLSALSSGLRPTEAFTRWLADQHGFVRRRDFYNSPVWDEAHVAGRVGLPQEVRLGPTVLALNVYPDAEWLLDSDGESIVLRHLPSGIDIESELLPDLATLMANPQIARVCNLYGGSALSFFSPRACYFFKDGTECRFCSLDGTAAESTDHPATVTPEDMYRSVTAVLEAEPERITQIMLVGGNDRDLDRGIERNLRLLHAAKRAVDDTGCEEVSLHLATMPPRDLSLIERFAELPGVHVMFNLETWNQDRFEAVAPGKHADYSRANLLRALEKLASVLEPFHAHSILIAGLEDPADTIAGMQWLAEHQISPIINCYHSDRHSQLGLSIRPDYDTLATVAEGLQALHARYPVKPYWVGRGRNALDFEASLGMFDGPRAPEYQSRSLTVDA